MKTITTLILACMLAACGGGEGEDEPTQTPQAEQPTKRPTPVPTECFTTSPPPASCTLVKS